MKINKYETKQLIARFKRDADGDPGDDSMIAAKTMESLMQLNDELLAVLIKLSNAYAFSKPPGYPKADVERQADSAIAKAQGTA